jgi:hypothetical protein
MWASSPDAEPKPAARSSSDARASAAARSTTAANSPAFEPKFWKITVSVTPTRSATSETLAAR